MNSMIRPSPNEFERLKNEEFNKRRLLRLKEVREYSKINASRLRHLYKEQKMKVIHKIAENIQDQINTEDDKKLTDLKLKYEKQLNAFGEAHNRASDWVDPIFEIQEKAEINHLIAQERQSNALNHLRIEKEDKQSVKNSRIDALNLAMLIEKERAAAIASLPPPMIPLYVQEALRNMDDITPRVRVCDKNKYSVIESYETCSYNVERITDEGQAYDAMAAGEMHQEHLMKLDSNMAMENEEHAIKAQLRGHHAIKKQIVQKDYSELITNLEHISKGEMAKRQREYHKNDFVGPNSAGYLGMGHMAAMIGYKERCRERAVESAVMESLKDITNKTSSQQRQIADEGIQIRETKLSKLYDIIKKQKENVSSEKTVVEDCLEPQTSAREDDVITNENDDIPRQTIEHAITATLRTGSLFEKSSCEKERIEIENKIQHIDMRLQKIDCDKNSNDTRTSSRSLSSSQHKIDVYSMSERSVRSTTESVCSDSLDIIREFQRQALLKLSGRSTARQSTTTLGTLERQFSDLSLVTASVTTDGSWLDSITPKTRTRNNRLQEVSSPSSQSSVSEWVKSQLTQNIDKIPDWVTKTCVDEQFMPDLNMSFMSSILNIRSETGSSTDDLNSSCSSTVLTHSSVVHRTRQSSITEVSNIGSATTNRSQTKLQNDSNTSFVIQQSTVISDLSTARDINDRASVLTLENEHSIDAGNVSQHKEDFVVDLGVEAYDGPDLIDFNSVEDLLASVEEGPSAEESSYQRALQELISIADSDHSHDLDIGQRTFEEETREDATEVPSVSQSHDYDKSEPSAVNDGRAIVEDFDVHLISSYQQFLAGLADKTIVSVPFSFVPQSCPASILPVCPDSHIMVDGPVTGQGDTEFSTPINQPVSDSNLGNQSPLHLSHLSLNSSQGSLHQLSPYSSEATDTVVSINDVRVSDEDPFAKERRMKSLLSSTMKPNRQNVELVSPDVSSISALSQEACHRLKQRVMLEYFEKNKNLIQAVLSSTNSSDLSLKPLESYEDSTPRNPDSGKPSSRLTMDNSELNTGRLTSEDLLMTARSDPNNWTEYTPRDQWSGSHNFHTLSEYESAVEKQVDLDETLTDTANGPSGDLINFDDSPEEHIYRCDVETDLMAALNHRDPSPPRTRPHDDEVPSMQSPQDTATRSLISLPSYHSSPGSLQSPGFQSDPDTSSLSLASFLHNEAECCEQEAVLVVKEAVLVAKEAVPVAKKASESALDSTEEARRQLASWKRDRLSRVNQHPPSPSVAISMVTTAGRKQSEVENRSRTLKLYNNLEEVQRQRQRKEAEQRRADNQVKRREYAERLRRLRGPRKDTSSG